jgi:hypothetical protein
MSHRSSNLAWSVTDGIGEARPLHHLCPVLATLYRMRLEQDEYPVTWSGSDNATASRAAIQPDLVRLDIESAGAPAVLNQPINQPAIDTSSLIITRRSEDAMSRPVRIRAEEAFLIRLGHPAGAGV